MAGTPDATVPRVVLAGGTNLSHALVQGKAVVIGRAKGVGMRIPHPSVSPMHCELVWDGGGVLLRDIGSELGTKVSGRAVTEPVVLEPGDLISVGIFTVEFQWDMLPEEEPESPEDAGQLAVHEVPLREPAPTRSGSRPPVLFRGGTVTEIPLDHALTIGSSSDADVVISGSSISPVHARVERVKDGFEIIDEGETGTLINGKYFERHSLTVGDFINIGSDFWFTYDGFALRRVEGASGCGLVGREIAVRGSHGHLILKDATFRADPGQFVGILGPSGAGKTTLLRALSGLVPLSEGEVLLDGKPLDEIPDPSEYLGFVPQQEIVHLELTGRMALRYSARLRLPKRTPAHEIAKLIDRLAGRLGLSEHLDKPAAQLSGGQLKRLSVCVELLNRPSLLFLDEPTSGLDPESETELMQQLQELTYTGCTVVCTTHLMENVYLLNSLEVVMAGRDEETGESIPGTGIFRGRPREARDFFGVRSLTKLYARLHEQSPPSWKKAFAEAFPGRVEAPPKVVKNGVPPRRARRWAVPVLLRRQRAILCSDWKNLLLLAGQPVLIALLIASVATGDTAGGTKLFLAYIATLWLGCSNAATEIVRERSIFRREQFVGLSSFSYLTSKSLWMGALTAAQALLIFGILKVAGSGLTGSALWQLGGLIASACAATGIGLSISAWAKTPGRRLACRPSSSCPSSSSPRSFSPGSSSPCRTGTSPLPRVSPAVFSPVSQPSVSWILACSGIGLSPTTSTSRKRGSTQLSTTSPPPSTHFPPGCPQIRERRSPSTRPPSTGCRRGKKSPWTSGPSSGQKTILPATV